MWPIAHRNAKDHNCGCHCERDDGHTGEHLCNHERWLAFHGEARGGEHQ